MAGKMTKTIIFNPKMTILLCKKNEFNQFPGTHFFGIFSVIFSILQKCVIFADFRKWICRPENGGQLEHTGSGVSKVRNSFFI